MKERMRQCVNYPISNLVCYNYTNKRPSVGDCKIDCLEHKMICVSAYRLKTQFMP